MKLKHLGEDVVTNTPTYKRLLDKASKILHMLKAEQVEASKVRAEAKKLRSIQETWREQLEVYLRDARLRSGLTSFQGE